MITDALWAVPWSNGCCSVFSGPTDPKRAREIAMRRRGCADDGWPERVGARFVSALPVRFLELGVTSRRRLNAPKSGRVRILEREMAWSGPHRRFASRSFEPRESFARARDYLVLQPCPTRLWSCVQMMKELVIFNAPTFQAACEWAEQNLDAPNPREDCESIERVELHLAPEKDRFSPICYRVWVEGYKVGWPERTLSGGEDMPPPLAAEARLMIPGYARVDADGARRRRPLRVQDG